MGVWDRLGYVRADNRIDPRISSQGVTQKKEAGLGKQSVESEV